MFTITSCLIQEMAAFIGNSVEAEHWFLGAPSPSLHFARALSFSVCVQERFPISASRSSRFSRVEARNDLAKPVEVDAFEGDRIKAFSHRIPYLTTSH